MSPELSILWKALYFEEVGARVRQIGSRTRTMKILHVVPTYYPAVRYGGPIRSVHGLASALAAQGHEVHVYTTNVDGEEVLPVSLDRPARLDGVTVWYFATSVGRRLYRSPRDASSARFEHCEFRYSPFAFCISLADFGRSSGGTKGRACLMSCRLAECLWGI